MCDECLIGSLTSHDRSEAPLSRRDLLARGAAVAAITATKSWSVPAETAIEALTSRRTRDIICREAWGARDPSGKFHRHTVHRLTVHHSGSVLRDNRDAPDRLRAIQADHQAEGWPDIAYHIVIDRHGNVYKGRPTWARGDTHTSYDTRGHLLVMCLGNFSAQQISHRQAVALVDVLAWACSRFDVRPRTIAGHRDYAATECPGTDLYRMIRRGVIQDRVRKRLNAGGVSLDKLCGRAGRRRVRRIEEGRDD